MDRPDKLDFLIAVLGEHGAAALKKAAERSHEIEAVLVPRTVLAWLGLAGADYDGELPGLGNSCLVFSKSEDTYTGSIGIGEDVYGFDRASLLHVASAVAVALGVDADRFDPGLRDLDLARLGKNIDLLVKARHVAAQVAAGEELMKAISLIPPGPQIREPRAAEAKVYDYSHVLPPHHQRNGFKLQVRHHPDSGTVVAKVLKGPMEIGSVKGVHENGSLNIEDAEVNEDHQGKGFGTSLYESLMAHAHHSGIKTVAGAVHSTMASGLHRKLSRKHGMEYKPVPTPFPKLASPTPGPFDARMGPYEYAIKEEVPANKPQISLYRAANDDYVDSGYSFTEDPGVAHAYTRNPGFGGKNIYRTTISPNPKQIIDLTGKPISHIARLTGQADPGAINANAWLPTNPRAIDALRSKGYLWAKVDEDYPEGASPTWLWLGDAAEDADLEPQLELHSPIDKAEPPGPAHAPTPQGDQQAPAQPTLQSAKGPTKPKKLPLAPGMAKPARAIKISKSQAESKCALCGLAQFKEGSFRGCLCFRSLSKAVKATPEADGYRLEFGSGWDEEALQTLLETIGSK